MRVELKTVGLLGIAGKDASAFLQGQFSCDVSQVSDTHSVFGVHANPQGRLLSIFKLLLKDDTYLLQLPLALLDVAKAALQKYAIFYNASLENKSLLYRRIGFIDEKPQGISLLPDALHNCITEGDITVLYWQGKKPRYELIAPHARLASIHTNHPEQAWKLCNIQVGYPQIYPSTAGLFLPHTLALKKWDALNFKKGCYTGQEIIARMEYLGKTKQSLYYLTANTINLPLPGDSLYAHQKKVGMVVDALTDEDTLHMLAVLPLNQPDSPITLDEEGNLLLTRNPL